MSENKAKEHLRAMLASFTAGTVLHLLAEVVRAYADEAGDDLAVERGVAVQATLFVVGFGDRRRPTPLNPGGAVTSDSVRDDLRAMRATHSVGSILGLLAEVVQEEADAEFVAGDLTAEEQSRLCVSALFAVGLGLDAIRRNTRGSA